MPYIKSNHDGATLFYRDHIPATSPSPFKPVLPPAPSSPSTAPAILFSSAWPFSSHMWDHLAVPLCETHRYRCILPDRRGYGQSEWSGDQTGAAVRTDYDVFAADLAHVMESTLASVESFIGIGASLGCGELLLTLANQPQWLKKCRGLVFVGSSLPIPLRTSLKPNGPERPFWDKLLDDLREDCMGTAVGTLPFIFGKGESNQLAPSVMRRYERIVEQSEPLAIERTVQAFLDRDLTQTMQELGHVVEFPILILHGSEDVVNPVNEGPELCKRFMPTINIKLYDGAAHGMAQTHKNKCLEDIADFLNQVSGRRNAA